MKRRFQIIIGSPIDYEELVAYIVVDGEHIAFLSQEEGKDRMQICFFDEPRINKIDFDLFVEALQEAKNELMK